MAEILSRDELSEYEERLLEGGDALSVYEAARLLQTQLHWQSPRICLRSEPAKVGAISQSRSILPNRGQIAVLTAGGCGMKKDNRGFYILGPSTVGLKHTLDWCHVCGNRIVGHVEIWFRGNAEHFLDGNKPANDTTSYMRICKTCVKALNDVINP